MGLLDSSYSLPQLLYSIIESRFSEGFLSCLFPLHFLDELLLNFFKLPHSFL